MTGKQVNIQQVKKVFSVVRSFLVRTQDVLLKLTRILQVLAEMTDGGLDYTFECIGNVKIMVNITHFI